MTAILVKIFTILHLVECLHLVDCLTEVLFEVNCDSQNYSFCLSKCKKYEFYLHIVFLYTSMCPTMGISSHDFFLPQNDDK